MPTQKSERHKQLLERKFLMCDKGYGCDTSIEHINITAGLLQCP